MHNLDPYAVLEVSRAATQEEIKSAYRKKALKYHPDRNQDDRTAEEKFKNVSSAYSMIGDPESRESYDQSKIPHRPRQRPQNFEDVFRGANFNFSQSSRSDSGQASWDDLFGSFRAQSRRPYTIKARVDVSLEDLVHGNKKSFMLDGSSVTFSVPRAARDGMTVVVPMRKNSQELHASINISKHPIFAVDGDDLKCRINVPALTAIAGGELEAVTLENVVRLKISPFTGSHKKLRVKNYGLYRDDGTRGSIIYELVITFDELSEQERKSLLNYFA